ncbi:N-acetylmuramoyl-L-alanine amidase [Paenibacillus turpanensis]|uniref:N-acetylmuramoyl-L-alanine amidase n=1 Tax=Paenibacillus turpanensis TaxID=2689078 RepID=UPI00140B98FA|nr:N-acetylmuramoyl-L-alanine amidase [Paenibacillus turpanensis]
MKRTPLTVLSAALAVSILLPGTASAAKIIIDPGHGGKDPGAVGINGLYEKTVNFDISKRLQVSLEKKGHQVLLTRTSDQSLSLSERIQIVSSMKGDILVSVHANAHTTKDAKGSLVLYYDHRYPQSRYPASSAMIDIWEESHKLAEAVQGALVQKAGTVNLGTVPSAAYMVRMGDIPSILVETAFLSNPSDAALLANESVRQRMAEGISEGIDAYLPEPEQQAKKPSAEGSSGAKGTKDSASFRDMASHWANDSVVRLKKSSIVNGVDSRFLPERSLTRAELITMMERAEALEDREAENGAAEDAASSKKAVKPAPVTIESARSKLLPYKDLLDNHWAYKPLSVAALTGKITGFPDGSIKPDNTVSRAELAVIVNRYVNSRTAKSQTGTEASSTAAAKASGVFKDVSTDHWAGEAIGHLNQIGLLRGTGTGRTYDPSRFVTRAETAVVIDRYLTYLQTNDKAAKETK